MSSPAVVHPEWVDPLPQDREERHQQLAEQRRFLAVSCAAFDGGDHAEAKRMATTLRVLLEQFGSGAALLVQLDMRDQLGWLDTAGSILPSGAGAQTPLVHLSADEGTNRGRLRWLPRLDAWDRRLQERPQLSPEVEETLARMREERTWRSRGSWLPFAQWWAADVLRDLSERTVTRAELVNALANTDREAHVDPQLEELYHRLSRPTSADWVTGLPNAPWLTPALASVRQIAFEVETSLHRGAPARTEQHASVQ